MTKTPLKDEVTVKRPFLNEKCRAHFNGGRGIYYLKLYNSPGTLSLNLVSHRLNPMHHILMVQWLQLA
jgi:hypothetical protein